jgi:prophage regulatory protein
MSSAEKIIRRPEVEELTGLSYSSIYRKERAGKFPPRLILGANSVGWRKSEILEWVNSRPTVAQTEGPDHAA